MSTDENSTQDFIRDLKEKYHYPEEAVKTDVKGDFARFDVVIQKGNMYVQAFEVKPNKNNEEAIGGQMKILSQKLNDISVDTPLYCAIYNHEKSEWELYSESNLKKPIADVEQVLNYREAVVKFLGIAREQVIAQPKEFPWLCWIMAFILFAYLVVYLLCDYCILEPPILPSPLSAEFLIYIGLVVFLTLLPSLFKLLNNIKRIRFSIFELELKEKLDL